MQRPKRKRRNTRDENAPADVIYLPNGNVVFGIIGVRVAGPVPPIFLSDEEPPAKKPKAKPKTKSKN